MKKKTFIHKDLSEQTSDNIRRALGTHAVKEEVDAPPKPYEDFKLREKYHRYSFLNEHLSVTPYDFAGEIHSSGLDLRDLEVLQATITHDEGDKYQILDSLEINPARITHIDNTKLTPNFKIPTRIYSNQDFNRGDRFWNNVFMGGNYEGVSYPRMIDTNSMFYHSLFTMRAYEPAHLYKNLNIDDAVMADLTDEEKLALSDPIGFTTEGTEANQVYNITCYYPDYNNYVANYQQWESGTHELLLPNYNFEAMVNFEWNTGLSSIFYSTGRFFGGGAGEFSELSSDRERLLRVKDESPNYKHLLDYHYPLNPEIYSGMYDEETLVSEDTDILSVVESANYFKRHQYYGDQWIYNWAESAPAELKQKVINANKNILFGENYWFYILRQPLEDYYNELYKKQNTALLNAAIITFEMDTQQGKSELSDGEEKSYGDTSTSDVKYHIRNTIAKNGMTIKFLEMLKDLDDGVLPGFNYDEHNYKVQTDVVQPIKNETLDSHVANYDYYTDSIRLDCVDFTNFLVYMMRNPTVAINDNYIQIGSHSGYEGSSRSEIYTEAGGNALYSYANYAGISEILNQTILDSHRIFRNIMPDEIEKTIDLTGTPADTSLTISNYVYNTIFKPTENFRETLAYKIEKVGGPAVQPGRTKEVLQSFWVWNSSGASVEVSPELGVEVGAGGEEYRKPMRIVDSQVKYGQTYTYYGYAYVLVNAYKYKYSDFRLTKVTNAYGPSVEEGFPDKLFCVQFYDPTDQIIKPQIFAISSAPERDPDTRLYSNLSEYNTFATNEHDILKNPQVADFYYNIEPCLKLIKVPIFEKTITITDEPANKISVTPFHVIDNTEKIGFSVMQDNFAEMYYPACITPRDQILKEKYLKTKDLTETERIKAFSESPARYLEVYRISDEPTSYLSFDKHLVSKIDLRIPNTNYNRIDYIVTDKVKPNKTYYYLFRFVTENGMPGHLSTIYKAKLVDDGGYQYATFDAYDTSNFVVNHFEETTKSAKKLLQLEPNISQLMMDLSEVDLTDRAQGQLDKIEIGKGVEQLWNKTFKIRLTSKKSGKKTDINVSYKRRTKDLSK